MHIVMKERARYRLMERDGAAWEYGSLEQVAEALSACVGRWSETWREAVVPAFTTERREHGGPNGRLELVEIGRFVLLGTDGEPVPVATVIAAHLAKRRAARPKRPEGAFRDGPWPGLRHARGSYRGIRRMRTQQSLAWDRAHDGEVAEAGRPVAQARRTRRIPTSWDDVPRRCERSWKAHRRRQHRD